MRFHNFGPYPIEFGLHGATEDQSKFWRSIDEDKPTLSTARGCYIFGTKASKKGSMTLWYVGKTNRSFQAECFEPHKKKLYIRAMRESKSKLPYFFFIAPMQDDDTISHAKYVYTIGFIEKYFIGLALKSNGQLLNQIDTKIHRELELQGFFNDKQTEEDSATHQLKRALQI